MRDAQRDIESRPSMTTHGTFKLPGTSMTVNRIGYGAMQLVGPGVFGPPRDVDAAMAVLREAVDSLAPRSVRW